MWLIGDVVQASYWSQVHRTLVADLYTPQPREGALDPVENLNLTPQPCSSPKLSPTLSSFLRDRGCMAMRRHGIPTKCDTRQRQADGADCRPLSLFGPPVGLDRETRSHGCLGGLRQRRRTLSLSP